jgi:gamma-glutamylcyclotransferase (GGCT)/AIG2-like uncharacterized protein YtfP
MPLFFAYGTLAPLDAESAIREEWDLDAVRGRLYHLGPYPALVDHEDGASDWVEGYVRPVTWEQLEGSLDSYEGVAEGLYRRVMVMTRAGREVWVYIYGRALPSTAIGPLARWNSTKRVRFFTPPGNQQGGPG